MYITAPTLMQAFSERTLIQLSNDTYQAQEVDFSVLAQAIQFAQERIDAALRSRYRLPLSDVPTLIGLHSLTLARYWLYARRPEMDMPEMVKETYQQAIKELDQIASGRLHLGIAQFTAEQATEEQGDILADSGEYQVKSGHRIDTEGY